MKKLKYYEQAATEARVLEGQISKATKDKSNGAAVLHMNLDGGFVGLIYEKEVDALSIPKSLIGFLGRTVNFIITGIDVENKTFTCSRKAAQEKLTENLASVMGDGAAKEGVVVSMTNYGAFVEVDGVTGMMKNSDFSSDHTPVKDVLKEGHKISVILKRVSDSNKLAFEAEKKYENPRKDSAASFKEDEVVVGVIRNVKPNGVFVSIGSGIDALAPNPQVGEFVEGAKVSLKITSVDVEKNRVRGKLLRTITC